MIIEYLEEFKKISKDFYSQHNRREDLVRQYSWAIPTSKILSIIKRYSPIIEIGAGTGYWAKLLEDIGCDILPIDKNPPKTKHNTFVHKKEYTSVVEGDQETVKLFPDCNIFLCWPRMDNTAYLAATYLKVSNFLIYVGELEYGCTADRAFFEYIQSNFILVDNAIIPQWCEIQDTFLVYKKVKE